jgi:ABC-type lipoprotein release transport system permease subunit
MFRLALGTLRFRTAGFVASFVVVVLGATMVIAAGGLLESGIRATVPPQRLTAPPIVVTGDQRYRDETLPERARLDSHHVSRLESLPGVTRAVPDVSFPVTVVRDRLPLALDLPLDGHGWISAQLTPFRLQEGRAPRGAREVVLDVALAGSTGTRVGDSLALAIRGTTERYRVSGVAYAPSVGSNSIFFFDGATSRLLGKAGNVDARALAGPIAASTAVPSAMLWAAGLALLGPGIARSITAIFALPVRAASGLAGQLAMLNVRASRVRTAAALTPIMLATGFATALLYMQTSQTSAAVDAYTNNLRADAVLSSSTGGLPLGLVRDVREQPGVAEASAYVTSTGYFERPGEDAAIVPLQGIEAEGAAQTTAFELTAGSLSRLQGNTIALSERHTREGRDVGDTIPVRLGDGSVTGLEIVAEFSAERGYETALLPATLLARHTTDGLADQILVRAAPETDPRRLRATLTSLSDRHPGLTVADRTEATAEYTEAQEISAWANYLFVAVIVGYTVVSLVNALVFATAARRREFALQRLIGSTRGQVVRMMGIEGLFVALAGTALGTLVAAATLVPFNLALKDSPTPAGPAWIYLTVISLATALTLLATLVPTALALRARPVEAVAART